MLTWSQFNLYTPQMIWQSKNLLIHILRFSLLPLCFCTLFFPFCLLGACKNSLWLKVTQSKYDTWYLKDTNILHNCWDSSTLVVPSHFIQSTTCPRISLSSYDWRISKLKVYYMQQSRNHTSLTNKLNRFQTFWPNPEPFISGNWHKTEMADFIVWLL